MSVRINVSFVVTNFTFISLLISRTFFFQLDFRTNTVPVFFSLYERVQNVQVTIFLDHVEFYDLFFLVFSGPRFSD